MRKGKLKPTQTAFLKLFTNQDTKHLVVKSKNGNESLLFGGIVSADAEKIAAAKRGEAPLGIEKQRDEFNQFQQDFLKAEERSHWSGYGADCRNVTSGGFRYGFFC